MSALRNGLVLAAALAIGALLGTTAGCDPRNGREAECVDSGECDIQEGELVACVSGSCEDVECLLSTDCALGTYCDVEGDYSCVDGCLGDNDCLAGYSCNDGSCEQDDCRSTVLDCDFKEVCNEDSGECEAVGGVLCARCDPSFHEFDDQSTIFDFCDDDFLGHADCGVGALCWNQVGEATGHCMTPCETNADCPHGFQCGSLVFGATQCDDPNTPALEGVFSTPVCLSNACGD
jgi:hypothetical protein